MCSPFDGSRLATVEQADRGGVECALATADGLFRNRDGWLSPADRIAILRKAAAIMQQRRDELALEAAREGGKPLTDSRVEVDRAIDGVSLCAEHLRAQAGSEIPMNRNAASAGRLAFTQYEPIGVVLAFSAFNHPLNMIVHQVGPAVAAGCPVIVKPAAAAPLSCLRFVRILREAGLPEAWCQPLLLTDHGLAEEMVADRRVGYFSFVGSGKVGWALRSRLAPGTRCGLEHGGVAPVIVAADADLDYALPLLAKGGFYHAGQVCVSVQRVFAQRQIARPLAERLAELANALKVGDPTLPETEVGPLIRQREVGRVDRVGAGGRRARRESDVWRPGDFRQLLRADRAVGPARRRPRDDRRGVWPRGLRVDVRRPRRGNRQGQLAAMCVSSRRLYARSRYGAAVLPPPERLGGHGQRPHGLPRRLDALCRIDGVRIGHRRHSVYNGRNADSEVDCDSVQGNFDGIVGWELPHSLVPPYR